MSSEVKTRTEEAKLTTKDRIGILLKNAPTSYSLDEAVPGFYKQSIQLAIARFEEVFTARFPRPSLDLLEELRSFVSLKPSQDPIPTNTPPYFDRRFQNILDLSHLSVDDPKMQIIKIGFNTQVAKDQAVAVSKELLQKAEMFGGIFFEDKMPGYIKNIGEQALKVRSFQQRMEEGTESIRRIAQKAGLDAKKIDLLFDIAFFKVRSQDEDGEITKALEPLVILIAQGHFEEAFLHRDFLFKHFRNSGGLQFVAEKYRNGKLFIQDEEIPQGYKWVFQNGNYSEKEQGGNAEIIRHSLPLAIAFLQELEKEGTAMEVEQFLKKILGKNGTALFEEQGRQRRFEKFMELMEEVSPTMRFSEANALHQDLEQKIQKMIGKTGFPYIVYAPRERKILMVEIQNGQLICFYEARPITTSKDGVREEFKPKIHPMDFGMLLIKIVECSTKRNENGKESDKIKHVLPLSRVKSALEKAYSTECSRDPQLARFTLKEYLEAIISNADLNQNTEEKNIINQFIRGFT